MGFDSASKYSADSIEKSRQLAVFLKKRQAIEEDYARALRKLCKSISLSPMKKSRASGSGSGGRSSFLKYIFGSSKQLPMQQALKESSAGTERENGDGAEVVDPSNSSLWSTFYELVDDTSQFSKAHAGFAESLEKQLIEPLGKIIREMDHARNEIVKEGEELYRRLKQAQSEYSKAKKEYDESNTKVVELRAIFQRIELQPTIVKTKDYEKAKSKCEQAEDKCVMARQLFKTKQDQFKAINAQVLNSALPGLLVRFHEAESQRNCNVVSHILGLLELERRCISMCSTYADEMSHKLGQINLMDDDHLFQTNVLQTNAAGTGLAATNVTTSMSLPSTPTSPDLGRGDIPSRPLSIYPSSSSPMYTKDAPVLTNGAGEAPLSFPSLPPAYTAEDVLCGFRTMPTSRSELMMPDRLGRSDGFDYSH